MIDKHLPRRSGCAHFTTLETAHALVAGLLMGGRGLRATETLRADTLAEKIFGLERGAPSAPTLYRALCEWAGLSERPREDWYAPAGESLAALDMFGRERKQPATRRIVPDQPEAATPRARQRFAEFVAASARRCAAALPQTVVRMHGWHVAFGDATDLEVDGECFDAARMGRDGKKAMRWMTLMLGPVLVAEELGLGNRDEGLAMPAVLERARATVGEIVGARARVLALLDAAYFERQVIEPISSERFGWDFIVCANQQRGLLERLAAEQPAQVWRATGRDARRGWIESAVCCFRHQPEGWSAPVRIVARRWRKAGDLPGFWHYSFLATRVEPAGLPKKLIEKHGYCAAIWMLYGTKQGRENHYKTALRDLGLHHPPSCRLGVNQAFYALAAAAANVAMVMRYRVIGDPAERGMTLWRMRELYFRIAGYVVRSGRRLTVRLAGASVDAWRQTRWRTAFAAAGRL